MHEIMKYKTNFCCLLQQTFLWPRVEYGQTTRALSFVKKSNPLGVARNFPNLQGQLHATVQPQFTSSKQMRGSDTWQFASRKTCLWLNQPSFARTTLSADNHFEHKQKPVQCPMGTVRFVCGCQRSVYSVCSKTYIEDELISHQRMWSTVNPGPPAVLWRSKVAPEAAKVSIVYITKFFQIKHVTCVKLPFLSIRRV